MTVSDAVAMRRSVRAFLDQPVSERVLASLVMAAARAPSGGNLQPWSVDIVTGNRIHSLKAMMAERVARSNCDPQLDFQIYPDPLRDPHHARRREISESLYTSLGIERADKERRQAWFRRNFQLFDAPAAIFVHVERSMGPPQWADVGMFVQTFMLLCVEAGLSTCPQECWALYPETMRRFLESDEELILFCGIAVGFEDKGHSSASLRSARAPEGEFIRYHCA